MSDQSTTSAELLQQALEAERQKSQSLAKTNAALIQEFGSADTYEEQLKIAKDAIKDILPTAIQTLNELIVSSDKDSVRASLAKYVVDAVLSGKLDSDADSEVARMLRELGKIGENIPDQVVNGD